MSLPLFVPRLASTSLVRLAQSRSNRELRILCAWVTVDNRPFLAKFRDTLVESPHDARSHDVGDLHRVLELIDSSNDDVQTRRNLPVMVLVPLPAARSSLPSTVAVPRRNPLSFCSFGVSPCVVPLSSTPSCKGENVQSLAVASLTNVLFRCACSVDVNGCISRPSVVMSTVACGVS